MFCQLFKLVFSFCCVCKPLLKYFIDTLFRRKNMEIFVRSKSVFFYLIFNWTNEQILVLTFNLIKYIFSIRVFFHGHWRLTGQQGRGGDHLLFHSTPSIRSWTFWYLFSTLHVRWLSHIFNRTTCFYQTATQWDLLPYWITMLLIDDVMLIFVFLLDDSIPGFITAIWHEKPVDSNSHWLSPLYYKRTD